MTTNVRQQLPGVACNLQTFSSLLTILFLAISYNCLSVSGMPATRNARDVGQNLVGWNNRELHSVYRYFATAKNSNLLQLHKDGTVNGSNCKTKYAAFQMIPHHIKSKSIGNKSEVAMIYGVESNMYLCLNTDTNTLYGSAVIDEKDCAFTFDITWFNRQAIGAENGPIVYDMNKIYHHHTKYFIGLDCRGKPLVVKTCRARRKYRKYLKFNVGTIDNLRNLPTECSTKPKCSSQTKYLHFCRRVNKNFFTSTVRDWKKYIRRKCNKRLRKEEHRAMRREQYCSDRNKRRKRRHINATVPPT